MSLLTNQAQRWLFGIDDLWARNYRAMRQVLGLEHTPRVQPLDGWRTREGIVVRARILESRSEAELRAVPSGKGSRARRSWRRLRLLYRRYATVEVPEAEVEVSCEGVRCTVRSDARGYVVARLRLPDPSNPSSARVALKEGSATPMDVPVFSASTRAERLVISDIDDTVLETEISNPARRFAQLLLADQPVRLPFEGVETLFQALVRGGAAPFYVSNSPIHLHHHLVTMFRSHALPPGPLLLYEFRPPAPDGHGGPERVRHKDRALRILAEDHPNLPLVLIGDTTRHDADHYLRLAERAPERVEAIFLRRVPGRLSWGVDEEALREHAEGIGVELHIVDSTEELARHAAHRGWVAPQDPACSPAAAGHGHGDPK